MNPLRKEIQVQIQHFCSFCSFLRWQILSARALAVDGKFPSKDLWDKKKEEMYDII